MRYLKPILFTILASTLLYACTYKKGEVPQPSVNTQPTGTAVISYSKDIKPIIIMYCLGTNGQSCHTGNSNQGASTNFTTYDGVKNDIAGIENRVINKNGPPMPPLNSNSPHLVPQDTLAKLQKWIDAGTNP